MHLNRKSLTVLFLPFLLVLAATITSLELPAAETVSDKVGTATADAGKQIQSASQAAEAKMQELWRAIDEQRLKNRTPDQIVAMVIIGLLVGGLIHQFTKLNKFATLLLGLTGAFLGGIVANLAQFNIGMGPVLVRYEELLASLGGGIVIAVVARLVAARRAPKK